MNSETVRNIALIRLSMNVIQLSKELTGSKARVVELEKSEVGVLHARATKAEELVKELLGALKEQGRVLEKVSAVNERISFQFRESACGWTDAALKNIAEGLEQAQARLASYPDSADAAVLKRYIERRTAQRDELLAKRADVEMALAELPNILGEGE